MPTRTDAHLQLDGDGTVVDNSWLWHADHDDCGGVWPAAKSDACYSGYGLLVQGEDVSVYDLKVEHVYKDHVNWKGENGQMFFLQEELPYQYLAFGSDGNVGYRVADNVQQHTAYGLGVYIVGVCGDMRNVTAISAPNTAWLHNMVAWDNGADVTAFSAILCHGGICSRGNCQGDKCRLANVPQPMPLPEETILISSVDSGKCLHLKEGMELPGTAVEVSTCETSNDAQHWQYIDHQVIHTTESGQQLCLDDPQETHARSGDKLKVTACDGTLSQKWMYDHLTGSVRFGTSNHSTFCADLTDGLTGDGTVQIWGCDASGGYKNQKWHVRAAGSKAETIMLV